MFQSLGGLHNKGLCICMIEAKSGCLNRSHGLYEHTKKTIAIEEEDCMIYVLTPIRQEKDQPPTCISLQLAYVLKQEQQLKLN